MLKKTILIMAAIFAIQHFSSGAKEVQINTENHDDVILYATSWCGYCKKTRAFLASNNINYSEYDVETSIEGREKFEALGGNGVPVLDIQGTVIHGYSIEKMKSTLIKFKLM